MSRLIIQLIMMLDSFYKTKLYYRQQNKKEIRGRASDIAEYMKDDIGGQVLIAVCIHSALES